MVLGLPLEKAMASTGTSVTDTKHLASKPPSSLLAMMSHWPAPTPVTTPPATVATLSLEVLQTTF